MIRHLTGFLFAATVIAGMTSCKGPQMLYEENLLFKDSANLAQYSGIAFKEPPIQINDVLYVQVQTADLRTSQMFMPMQQSIQQQGSLAVLQGYQVGADSAISFPVFGKIKAVGLTRLQLEDILTERIGAYLKEKPSVQVRYMNFKVNVLGDVTRPGTYTFPTDRVSILDALGSAGDLTLFARRNKVWIIREENQKRVFKYVNLQKAESFNAENYFLRQNDVVYVEPNQKKFIQADPVYSRTLQNISIGVSSLSIAIALISLLK